MASRTEAGAAVTAMKNPNGPGDHNLDHYLKNLKQNYAIQQKKSGFETFKEYIKQI